MKFAAGVDGGGTRTTVECRTMEGAERLCLSLVF